MRRLFHITEFVKDALLLTIVEVNELAKTVDARIEAKKE